MLWPEDQLLAARDPVLPGLELLLDEQAFLAALRAHNLLGASTLACRATYARYKPATSCLVGYDLVTASASAYIHAIAHRADDSKKYDASRAGAIRIADRRLIAYVFPNDSRLRALRALAQADTRAALLKKLFPSRQSHWDGTISGLAYKPLRRFVGKLSVAGQPCAVLKFCSREDFARTRRNAKLVQSAGCLRVPKRTGRSSRRRVVTYDWIDGQTGTLQPDWLARVGAALAELHRQDVHGLPHIGIREEARRISGAATGIAAVLPELGEWSAKLAHRLIEMWPAPESLVTIHGDFHARQVIATSERVGILDLDEIARGSPEADIGNFVAHLLADPGYDQTEALVARDAISRGRRDSGLPALHEGALNWHTAASLFRLSADPFRKRERGWPARIKLLLERVERMLRELPAQHRAIPLHDPFDVRQDNALRPFVGRALNANLISAHLGDARVEEIRLTRYRPGRRCVIEYDLCAGDGTRFTALGKVRRKGADGATRRVLRALRARGFDDRAPDSIFVPKPLAKIPEAGLWLQRKAPGTPASALLPCLGVDDATALARRIADACHKIHQSGVPTTRRHTLDDEITILCEQLRGATIRYPALSSRISAVAEACSDLAATALSEPAALCGIHRDFYADHVLVHGTRLCLIDFDLWCEGDPALDIGNFAAHLTEQSLRETGDPSSFAHIERAIEDRYVELTGAVVGHRIRAYALLTLARHIAISTRIHERNHLTFDLLELVETRIAAAMRNTHRALTIRFS